MFEYTLKSIAKTIQMPNNNRYIQHPTETVFIKIHMLFLSPIEIDIDSPHMQSDKPTGLCAIVLGKPIIIVLWI